MHNVRDMADISLTTSVHFSFTQILIKSIQVDNDWTCIKLNQQGHSFVTIEIVDWFMGSHFHVCKTNNICIARLMMRKQKLNMNFQYTALNMNYSVAGFQVDCLVTNFPKGLLVAIYAGKSISSASEDERGGHFALKYHLFFLMLLLP